MRLAITGGGTGGHLAIAKALGLECAKRGIYTLYIGSTRGQDRQWFERVNDSKKDSINPQIFSKSIFLESTPVVNQRYLGKFKALFKNIIESKKASAIMKKEKINACISVGGFSAAAASFGAIFSGLPFFIHEQNACMGALNALLKPFAKKFFSSFPYNGVTFTPYPTNEVFFRTQRQRGSLCKILFMGGSQGAKSINEFALKISPNLAQKNITIFHQTGKLDYENTLRAYENLGLKICILDSKNMESNLQDYIKNEKISPNVYIFDFYPNMAEIMREADFCISRAGASSLFELAANGLPTLFVPYPFAAKNHQYFNAKILSDENLALLKSQDSLSDTSAILNEIFSLDLSHISANLIAYARPNGASIIIDEVMKYARD